MLKLKFNYSIEYETERIKNTLSRLDWFREKGYKLSFPKNFTLEDEDFSDDNIKNTIVEEYNETDYKKVADTVNEQWLKFSPRLEKYFSETKIKFEDAYEIKLTKYGVAGSYNLPSTVIANIQAHYDAGLVKTIIHEIIHLSIQELIEKYEVEHWEKERIVDLIVFKIVPEIAKMQNISIDTKPIDEGFEKYYPDIEKVVKNL